MKKRKYKSIFEVLIFHEIFTISLFELRRPLCRRFLFKIKKCLCKTFFLVSLTKQTNKKSGKHEAKTRINQG